MLDIPHGTPTGLQQKHRFVIHMVVSVTHCLTALDIVILDMLIPVLGCLVRIVALVNVQISLLNYKFCN